MREGVLELDGSTSSTVIVAKFLHCQRVPVETVSPQRRTLARKPAVGPCRGRCGHPPCYALYYSISCPCCVLSSSSAILRARMAAPAAAGRARGSELDGVGVVHEEAEGRRHVAVHSDLVVVGDQARGVRLAHQPV